MKKFLLSVVIGATLLLITACGNNNSASTNASSFKNESVDSKTSDMKQAKKDVIINGVAFTEEMEKEFKRIYNLDPIPGEYWYDTRSGLWGVIGGQALSFIYPGHYYGELKADASNGNTGIFINGRQIPMAEAVIWSQVMGTPAQQGHYWLDGRGNVGYEGYAVPVFNLFVLANRNSYKGGGDNFWSSSLASGNSDGNFGYVSIPGSGITVTYGD